MNKVHIIGIGGIAMSAIAQFFLKKGYQVTGSDLEKNELIDQLQQQGARITIGHRANNISPDITKVIYSDAIPSENIELLRAKEYNIETLGRSEALALITKNKKVISAAGTHGKTTTSAMIANLFDASGKSPSFIIGGILNNFNSNFNIKSSNYFILEGDEYGKSFLKYPSDIGVIINIEFDHPDIYQDMDELLATYREYAINLKEYLVTNHKVLKQLNLSPKDLEAEVATVEINNSEAMFNITNIKEEELSSCFTLQYLGQEIGQFKVKALGKYNVKHAVEAMAIGKYCGLSFEEMREGLANWQGVKRRFEILYQDETISVITDYAHHPSEVHVVVDTFERIKTDKNKVVIFQPHQYLRTQRLFTDYTKVLNQTIDEKIVFKIYKVREKVTEKELTNLGIELSNIISQESVLYYDEFEELKSYLNDYQQEHQAMYLFLGAGNIDDFARKWAIELKSSII